MHHAQRARSAQGEQIMSDQDSVTRLEVLDAMERHGGGFVHALAIAWRKADPTNDEKLRIAFLDYWRTYCAMAVEDKLRMEAKKQ